MSKVDVLIPDKKNGIIVLEDGHASLYFLPDDGSRGFHGFGAKDGGGFTCIFCTKESLQQMLNKLTEIIAEL